MPQIFQVLKCYQCLVFQVHQTKKSNKFQCKMCGEKQSIKRHYGIGTGKDCRLHVQKLNGIRGEMEDASIQSNSDNEFEDKKSDDYTIEQEKNIANNSIKQSRWSAFVDTDEITEDTTNDPMFLGDKEVILEMPQKKKTRKFKTKINNSSNLEDSLNVTNNTSGFNTERVNAINDFESENVKCVKDSHNEYSGEKCLNKEQVTIKHYSSMSSKQKSPQKLEVLQKISTNSKWAQFVDTEDEDKGDEDKGDEDKGDENNEINRDNMSKPKHDKCMSNINNIFSLCDDIDLDNILDF